MKRRPGRYLPRGPKVGRQVVGVGWYSPGGWTRLKSVVADPDRLEDSHARWLEVASDACAKLAAQGIEIVRIEVDPDEFLAWCRDQGLPADGKARAQFAADKLRRLDQGRNPNGAGEGER